MNKVRPLERRASIAISQLIKPSNTRNLSTARAIGLHPGPPLFRNVSAQTIKRPVPSATCLRSRNVGRWRLNSTKQSPDPTPNLGSPEPAPSLSQRLKKLSREYGWTAMGVYLALSALDFPFCFLAVRALGTERIGQWEHNVAQWVKSVVAVPFPGLIKDTGEGTVEAAVREGSAALDDQVMKSRESSATIWTQLGVAYAIHKSLIFFRVPLTAAVLPKVVRTLRKWGFDIGKRRPKAS